MIFIIKVLMCHLIVFPTAMCMDHFDLKFFSHVLFFTINFFLPFPPYLETFLGFSGHIIGSMKCHHFYHSNQDFKSANLLWYLLSSHSWFTNRILILCLQYILWICRHQCLIFLHKDCVLEQFYIYRKVRFPYTQTIPLLVTN